MKYRIKLVSLVLLVAFAGSASGCNLVKGLIKKKEDPAAAASAAASAPPATVAPATEPTATAPAIADEAIPSPEDFEEEAFEKVSPGNYQAELAKIKKEIQKP